ncbi:MAG: Ribosomal small subunit methyltransferase [Planctomycetota bacterium]|jgi:16S rRNA (guanine966-N2)-methyltransferase
MKIIAGERKGFKLEGPMDKSIRPTSDLRRDAIFNTLGELLIDETFYDIFSGTGAMGLESLSRGASKAMLVEMSKKAQELIRRNIEKVRYQKETKLFPTNAYRWIESHRPSESGIYFLDPPFPEYVNHPERFSKYLKMLMERVAEGSIIIVESRWKMNPEVLPVPDQWYMRRYGETRVAYWGLVDDEPDDQADHEHDPDSDPEWNEPDSE